MHGGHEMHGEEEPPAGRRGRKRDPSLSARVLTAAVELYAEGGWSAFNFEAISRAANVGKPAVYRRWSSREELLGQALAQLSWPIAADQGDLRSDLVDWATRMMLWWKTPAGAAYLRWLVDLRYEVDLGAPYDSIVQGRATALDDVLVRAEARGEIVADFDRVLLLEMVNGAVFSRALATPWLDATESYAARYAARCVDLALAAVTPSTSARLTRRS